MQQDPKRNARGLVTKLGGLLLFTAFLCNPHFLSALQYDARIDGVVSVAAIHAVQALLAIGAVLILRRRSSPRVVAAAAAMDSRHPVLPILVLMIASGVLTAEALSYVFFFHFAPADLRRRALLSVGIEEPGESEFVPAVMPYLWSNYAPNPSSRKVNQHGWRYGGGPRREKVRILCLGGSTTWSDAVSSPERSYPAQLEAYLQGLGYSVDVVNGGAPYYTSAELIGTLAFRGVYTDPDIILIHTGGNDVGPLLSPEDYVPDYSHWRRPHSMHEFLGSHDGKFAIVWRIPSWTLRYVSMMFLKPDGRSRLQVGRQISRSWDGLTANNHIFDREHTGLEQNLRTLIDMSRGYGARPATILFNARVDGFHRVFGSLSKNRELYDRVRRRAAYGYGKSNESMERISEEMNVPVIPFDSFSPSSDDYWLDNAHLNDEGCREKAIFIGDWLIEHGFLERATAPVDM